MKSRPKSQLKSRQHAEPCPILAKLPILAQGRRQIPANARIGAVLGLVLLAAAALWAPRVAGAADKSASDRAYEQAREHADKIKGATNPGSRGGTGKDTTGAASGADATKLPKGDPCKLLSDAEVRKIYPKASAAKPERTREKYGIAACVWEHASGKLVVQLTEALPKTSGEEARGLAIGFVDPLKPVAARKVRFERVFGVGEEATAVVEQQDDARGILTDAAYLIAQRGDRQVMIIAVDLARGDRAAALKTLEELGRAAMGRL